jgi:hypothetical protein
MPLTSHHHHQQMAQQKHRTHQHSNLHYTKNNIDWVTSKITIFPPSKMHSSFIHLGLKPHILTHLHIFIHKLLSFFYCLSFLFCLFTTQKKEQYNLLILPLFVNFTPFKGTLGSIQFNLTYLPEEKQLIIHLIRAKVCCCAGRINGINLKI